VALVNFEGIGRAASCLLLTGQNTFNFLFSLYAPSRTQRVVGDVLVHHP